VHALLNPQVPVIADPDRRRAALHATAHGADALVLDDAFQHRQMPRDVDVVLVSADLWHDGPVRLLPAGPFREPLLALRRATVVLVTRKAASADRAAAVASQLRASAGGIAVGVVHLRPDELRAWGGDATASAETLRVERVLAISGIGAPEAFAAQLRTFDAQVTEAPFGDHHAYTTDDVADLVRRASAVDRVVCTLKDAVKLGPQWPAAAPRLWYLSQAVVLETGGAELHAVLDRLASR
jgi:tetraacyldisaccharide 4'-kinase